MVAPLLAAKPRGGRLGGAALLRGQAPYLVACVLFVLIVFGPSGRLSVSQVNVSIARGPSAQQAQAGAADAAPAALAAATAAAAGGGGGGALEAGGQAEEEALHPDDEAAFQELQTAWREKRDLERQYGDLPEQPGLHPEQPDAAAAEASDADLAAAAEAWLQEEAAEAGQAVAAGAVGAEPAAPAEESLQPEEEAAFLELQAAWREKRELEQQTGGAALPLEQQPDKSAAAAGEPADAASAEPAVPEAPQEPEPAAVEVAAAEAVAGAAATEPGAEEEVPAAADGTAPAGQEAAAAEAASAAADAAVTGGEPADTSQPSAYERALQGCVTLACLKEAHEQPKHQGQYNLPHFYLLGFPKCATTSLFHHLIQHPSVMEPRIKEPNFYTSRCQGDAVGCSEREQLKYINDTLHLPAALEARLSKAVFEGSTHYSLAGEWLAPQLRELMPWVKLVLSMRDPITRAISMVQHNLAHGRNPTCLGEGGLIFRCVLEELEDDGGRFAPRLQAWVDTFPREQLFVMQYENLTSPEHMAEVLLEVKAFLDLPSPQLPSGELEYRNSKRDKYADGWPMLRSEYSQLVELARRDAEEVADIVRQHDFADADAWLANWEGVWQDILRNCEAGEAGACKIAYE